MKSLTYVKSPTSYPARACCPPCLAKRHMQRAVGGLRCKPVSQQRALPQRLSRTLIAHASKADTPLVSLADQERAVRKLQETKDLLLRAILDEEPSAIIVDRSPEAYMERNGPIALGRVLAAYTQFKELRQSLFQPDVAYEALRRIMEHAFEGGPFRAYDPWDIQFMMAAARSLDLHTEELFDGEEQSADIAFWLQEVHNFTQDTATFEKLLDAEEEAQAGPSQKHPPEFEEPGIYSYHMQQAQRLRAEVDWLRDISKDRDGSGMDPKVLDQTADLDFDGFMALELGLLMGSYLSIPPETVDPRPVFRAVSECFEGADEEGLPSCLPTHHVLMLSAALASCWFSREQKRQLHSWCGRAYEAMLNKE